MVTRFHMNITYGKSRREKHEPFLWSLFIIILMLFGLWSCGSHISPHPLSVIHLEQDRNNILICRTDQDNFTICDRDLNYYIRINKKVKLIVVPIGDLE
jgi:hypothetical protein